jgi:hypothetical protein
MLETLAAAKLTEVGSDVSGLPIAFKIERSILLNI